MPSKRRSILALGALLLAGREVCAAEELGPAPRAPEERAEPEKSAAGGGNQPGSAEVVAPVLEHYEPPVYPAGASQPGARVKVRLTLTVEADGTVSEAVVLEPVGEGFDEAALAAARLLVFAPARVGGTPRRVKIGFEYVFEPPEPATEVVSELPRWGNLEGRVLVSGPDSPLPGVNVSVRDALGNAYSATTDDQGRFFLTGLVPGAYSIEVVPDGFDGFSGEESVIAGEATEVVYRLAARAGENEIVVRGERPPREVTKRTLERREIERIPGTSGDALRSIQSLPGVARPPGLAGLLIVRGSAPQDTGYFVDGTSVPLIYHFGGLSSVIPTELLDRIDFYPGNFSVRYGRAMGGIVDAGFRSPNTDCYGPKGAPTDRKGCFHGMVQFDLIDGRVMVQGPIAKGWTFAVAGRRSYIDTWLKPVLEGTGASVTSAPVYYDYQVLVDHSSGPGDRLSLRFYGSDDRFETIITSPSAGEPGFGGNLRYSTAFTRAQIVYQKELTDRVSLDTQFSIGTDSIDFGLGGNLKFTIKSVPMYLRSEIGYKIHKTLRANLGLDFAVTPYEVSVRAPPFSRQGEAASGPFVTRPALESQTSETAFRPAWYTDLEWQPIERLRLVPGIRVDFARDSGQTDVSPRFTARYSLFLPEDNAPWGKGRTTVLKAGAGRFAQPPQFQETDPIFGTPGLGTNFSYHYSLGVEQGLTDHINLTVEGYYKDLDQLVSRAPSSTGSSYIYGNQGSGQVLGLETWLKYRADERFFGWVSYTLGESLRQDCPTCEERKFQYDQTHNLILLGSYRLGRGWEVGARFRIVSGPLTTPTVPGPALPAVFAGDAGSYVPIEGVPYSERLPLFHQLDVRIDKRWQFDSFRLNAYLDVQNVYNNAAYEDYVYNFNFSQKAYQTGLPILPSLGLRGEF